MCVYALVCVKVCLSGGFVMKQGFPNRTAKINYFLGMLKDALNGVCVCVCMCVCVCVSQG